MVSPPLNRHWHTLKIKVRAYRSPSKDALILHFWHVISTFPENAWGGIAARFSVPNGTETQQRYQSTEKTGWVENLYSSLQFNISVNCRWKAMISHTFSACFSVDKSPWGKSLFQFLCLRWLSQQIACQALLIGSSSLQTEFIDPHMHRLSWLWSHMLVPTHRSGHVDEGRELLPK